MGISVVVLLVLLVVVILVVYTVRQTATGHELVFDGEAALCSPSGRALLGIMEQVLDGHHRVMVKVHMGAVVKPASGMDSRRRSLAETSINSTILDFVICNAADSSVVGVVMMVEKHRSGETPRYEDEFFRRALAAVHMPVVYFDVNTAYTVAEVREKLQEGYGGLSFREALQDVPPILVCAERSRLGDRNNDVASKDCMAEADIPTCPHCASVMVRREVEKGPHAGKLFWACSTYPACRQLVALEE